MTAYSVTHIIHSSGFYGAERVLFDHCLHVPGQHHVCFIDAPPSLVQRFKTAGISCTSISGIGELKQQIQQNPTVLNAHNFRAQIFAWIVALQTKCPLIFTQHGFTPRSKKQKLYTKISLWLSKTKTVNHVVCVSQPLIDWHLGVGVDRQKLHLIVNGLPSKVLTRAPKEPATIGFVGRLSYEKGPDLLMDALIQVLPKHLDWQAVFIGDGPERTVLEQKVQHHNLSTRIKFVGFQNNIDPWLQQLSVLAISSRTEGTPMVLLEAMQAGLPVVSFAVGGIPNVITHEQQGGLLVHSGSVHELADALEQILTMPKLADRLGRLGKQRQAQSYDLSHIATQWQKLYEVTRANAC